MGFRLNKMFFFKYENAALKLRYECIAFEVCDKFDDVDGS